MMPSTALGLLLIGGAGALRCRQDAGPVRKAVSLVAAFIVLVIGVGALAAYAFPVDLHIHIDEVVVPAETGRPSPLAALALTCLATALFLFDCRPTARARPSEWLILFAGLTAFTALVGFVFGAGLLHQLTRAPLIGVALPTALSLLLTSTGLLLERSRGGLMSVAVSSGPGGVLLRRLVVPAILAPLVLGLIGTQLLRTLNIEELSVAGAVLTSTMVLVVLVLLTVTAVPLNRAHQALEENRSRTRNLLEQAPDGVFVADLSGRYTDVNTAGCRMLGYSRDEIIGKTIMDLIPPEEVERLAQSKEVMLKGAADIDEYKLRRKDGSYLPVEVSAGILPDGQWQGLVRDISERKRLEAALQRSYADLNRAQALGSIGSWRVDVHTNVLEWSEETHRIFGVPSGTTVTYERFLDCVHPDDRAYVHRAWRAALRGEPYDIEFRLVVGGRIRWVREKAELEFDERGELIGAVGMTQDITERKRFEEEQRRDKDRIRESQERFELALEGADLAAWDWNIKTGEIIFSPRWAEMRGLRPEDVRPHVDSWTSGMHPDDVPHVQKALADHFQGRTDDYRAELRVRTQSGRWLWLFDLGKVFARDEEGEPIRMVGVELDITERKRLEEELRIAEAKSSGIVSISADAIISIDRNQRITLFNEGAEKTFGYSKAEVIGAPLEILFPERYRTIHRRHAEKFATGKEGGRRMGGRGTPTFGLRKTGEEFPVDAAISKLDVGGTTILTVALRDVTEQKRVESDQRFLAEFGAVLASTLDYEETAKTIARLVVRHLGDVCIVETLEEDRGHMRRLVVAHRDPEQAEVARELQALQLDRSRPYLGSLVFDTKQPVLMTEVTEDYLASIAQNNEHSQILRELGPKSLVALPLMAHGRVVGSMVVISTTSGRWYAREDLPLLENVALRAALAVENARLYEVAQRAIQVRDDVLGIVAHDLRNPVGTILMQAALLRRQGGQPERRSRKPGELIERAATRMNHLIQDLLDVAMLEAGRLSVEQRRVSARQAILDSVETHEPLAVSASLRLRIQMARDLPDVWADRDRLLQIFDNLIGNAIKFTDPGGDITVGAAPRDGSVLFWVADTGAGISAEDLSHVFEWFWQARKAGPGVGLGLPIVKGIVDAHGGTIWAESAMGLGSKFCFTIPIAARVAADRRPQRAPHGP